LKKLRESKKKTKTGKGMDSTTIKKKAATARKLGWPSPGNSSEGKTRADMGTKEGGGRAGEKADRVSQEAVRK